MIGSYFFTHIGLFRFLHLMMINAFFVEHLASFNIELYPMIEINNNDVWNRFSFIKIWHWRTRIELVFLNTRPYFHWENIKFSPVSLRPRSSRMHSYTLSNGQKQFVSHMFAILQRWFVGTQLHLNPTDINRVLFYTTQKIRNLSSFFELGS